MKKNIEEVKDIVLENDFEEAQRILNLGDYTRNFDAEYLYNKRVESENFNRVFKIAIEREEDYFRFLDMVEKESKELFNNYNFLKIEYNEWKSGKLENGQRLGKFLRKKGYSKELLDFYATQIKTEKSVYLVITDCVQYIAGMSYYSTGDWDGMGGKTCQCPEIGGSYAKNLAGSLHDDKLFVGFIVENLNDLENMEEKMLARTVFRLLEDFDDGESVLIATRYYGNNETKNLLHEALKVVEEIAPIYSNDALGRDSYHEDTNGYAKVITIKDVYIYEDRTEYIDIDCPLCIGNGWIYAYDEHDNEHRVDCPHCHGDGEVEVEHYIYVDEYVEVEDAEEILPYDENYSHGGSYITIYLDTDYIEERMEERKERVKEGI